MSYEFDPRAREAYHLIDEFLKQLDACASQQQRRDKVLELIHGIQKAAVRRFAQEEEALDK